MEGLKKVKEIENNYDYYKNIETDKKDENLTDIRFSTYRIKNNNNKSKLSFEENFSLEEIC